MATTPQNSWSAPHAGLAGRVLVSLPHLEGGLFEKSVVLIGKHDVTGAFGLILNKPVPGVRARDVITELEVRCAVTAGDAEIFAGGPCEHKRGFVLHSPEYRDRGTLEVSPGLSISSSQAALERLMGDMPIPQRSRLFAGYSGWSPGQLDEELRRNAWLDAPATADMIFETPPDDLWQHTIARIGVSVPNLSALAADEAAESRPLQ